ncbi:MAG: hypothetical protein ACFUZC_02930 [Chthoniobacteraceae bacterium]
MTVTCLPLIEPNVRIARIRLSEAVLRFASWASPFGLQGETDQPVVIVESLV